MLIVIFVFFFNDTATTEIYTIAYTLSLHDALPISHTHTHTNVGKGTRMNMGRPLSRMVSAVLHVACTHAHAIENGILVIMTIV